jgi:hypothetical protein
MRNPLNCSLHIYDKKMSSPLYHTVLSLFTVYTGSHQFYFTNIKYDVGPSLKIFRIGESHHVFITRHVIYVQYSFFF